MRKAFFTIILLFPLFGWSQSVDSVKGEISAVDNEQIELAIINPQSEFYYPNLLMRYQKGDSTLTFDGYKHLYYGYAFQPEYRPLETIYAADSVNMVIESLEGETFDPNQLLRVVKHSQNVLKHSPFSLKHLNLLAFAYEQLGDMANARQFAIKTGMITEVIKASGSGLSEKSPWHILYRDDATDILFGMDLNVSKRIVMSRSVEFLSLLVREGRIKGYYFDVSRLYWNRPEGGNKEKRKMEFNPYSNPKSTRFVRPITY